MLRCVILEEEDELGFLAQRELGAAVQALGPWQSAALDREVIVEVCLIQVDLPQQDRQHARVVLRVHLGDHALGHRRLVGHVAHLGARERARA